MTATTHHSLTNHQLSMRLGHPAWVGRAASLAAEWLSRARERESLAQFTDRDLRDLGLSRLDASQEANKPFWRV
jgi:uncharacterized protein YjiS (DUF1127 family)